MNVSLSLGNFSCEFSFIYASFITISNSFLHQFNCENHFKEYKERNMVSSICDCEGKLYLRKDKENNVQKSCAPYVPVPYRSP